MGALSGVHHIPPPIRPHWKQCVARKADAMIWLPAHNGVNFTELVLPPGETPQDTRYKILGGPYGGAHCDDRPPPHW